MSSADEDVSSDSAPTGSSRSIWHVKAETARAVRQPAHPVRARVGHRDRHRPAQRQPVRPGGAGARSAERHRDAPVAAAPQGRGRGHRDRASSPQPTVKLAFELLALTATRSAEVRLATLGRDGRGRPRWDRPALRSASTGCRCAGELLRSSTRRGRSATAAASCSRCGAAARGRSCRRRCRRCSSTTRSPPLPRASGRRSGTGRRKRTDHPREVVEGALAHVVQNKGGGGLCPVGSVRAAAAADGQLGGAPCRQGPVMRP